MSNNKTIELPVLAWSLLRGLFANPGWAKTSKDIYTAGKLDFDGKLDLPESPDKGADAETTKKWGDTRISREFLGKEVEVTARCIEFYAKEGKLGTDKYVYELINAFVELE